MLGKIRNVLGLSARGCGPLQGAGGRTGTFSTSVIDVRSDTVTQPSAGMIVSMLDARVGDDVYGEDPSINELCRHAASVLGKEAALFVPSGTMGNLVSLAAVTAGAGLGSEVIVGDESHVYHYEQGGLSAVLGMAPNLVATAPDGTLPLQAVAEAIRADDAHYAHTAAIAIENTHNRCGGKVLPQQYLADLRALADEAGLPLHMDGARLWNAAVAGGVDPAEVAQHAHSVTVCLSKGLGAPVGSIVAGDADMVARAHRTRKMLGGGMRQAGVVAAAGKFAMAENLPKLAQDHRNARMIARGLAALPAVVLDVQEVHSNIIYFDLIGVQAADVVAAAKEAGVLISDYGTHKLRLVTHLQVSDAQAEVVLDTLTAAITSLAES